jgi:uncharacterized membrane protein required for colicin V production
MIVNFILDFLLLLGGVGGLLIGLRRGFIRMLLSTGALLLAIAFAALIAPPVVGIFVTRSGSQTETPIGAMFAALLAGIYALLEALLRRTFPNTRIAMLGVVDNVLGFVFAIPWTLLVLSLIVMLAGFISYAVYGSTGAGFIGEWYSTSNLVAFLQDFFEIPLNLMRFLFPSGLPQPLAFFAAN